MKINQNDGHRLETINQSITPEVWVGRQKRRKGYLSYADQFKEQHLVWTVWKHQFEIIIRAVISMARYLTDKGGHTQLYKIIQSTIRVKPLMTLVVFWFVLVSRGACSILTQKNTNGRNNKTKENTHNWPFTAIHRTTKPNEWNKANTHGPVIKWLDPQLFKMDFSLRCRVLWTLWADMRWN